MPSSAASDSSSSRIPPCPPMTSRASGSASRTRVIARMRCWNPFRGFSVPRANTTGVSPSIPSRSRADSVGIRSKMSVSYPFGTWTTSSLYGSSFERSRRLTRISRSASVHARVSRSLSESSCSWNQLRFAWTVRRYGTSSSSFRRAPTYPDVHDMWQWIRSNETGWSSSSFRTFRACCCPRKWSRWKSTGRYRRGVSTTWTLSGTFDWAIFESLPNPSPLSPGSREATSANQLYLTQTVTVSKYSASTSTCDLTKCLYPCETTRRSLSASWSRSMASRVRAGPFLIG